MKPPARLPFDLPTPAVIDGQDPAIAGDQRHLLDQAINDFLNLFKMETVIEIDLGFRTASLGSGLHPLDRATSTGPPSG